LLVLENKSMANSARCVLESADKTNVSRFLSEADGDSAAVHDRRIDYRLGQTRRQRGPKDRSVLVLDDTRCEQVDRHYNQGDGT
jgi:hypothetical protein